MKQHPRVLRIAFLLLLSSSLALPQASSLGSAPKQPQGNQASASPSPAREITAADVGAFFDGFMPMQLERENIAGAVVLVVKDGQVLFAKGYGYSDVEKKVPVTVDATLFRPGSISKLFTWTAVMQLVEQNKLDLDKDVDAYLDFKIPATQPHAITLRHIMTHTPGFEEQIKELIQDEAEGTPVATLQRHLAEHMPERIFAPGTTPAYSNYGAALAGYIVERVSGQPFNDYVAEHIFRPLGMSRTSFAQPLPDNLKPMMSKGYQTASGKPKPFELIEESPAGALSATAADIARFMIAHLQDGALGANTRILRPETARLMHSRQFALSPALNGMCLGFYEESRNGLRIIGHGGDTIYFHSDLHLVPEAGLGFFVSYNSAGKGELSPRSALWNHFLDRYYPYTPPAATLPTTAVADAKSVAGRYFSSRRSQTNFVKVTYMQGELNVTAEPDGDGVIKVDALKDFAGQVKKWQEISPLVYRAVNGQELLAFRRDESGRMQLVPNFPAIVYQRASFLQDSKFNGPLLIGSLIVMALTLAFWPIGAWARLHYHQPLELDARQRQARLWIRLVCAVNLIFIAALLATFSGAGANDLNAKMDLRVTFIQVIGVLGVLGLLAVVVACWRSWGDRTVWIGNKVWNFIVLLACLGFVWFVLYWNMLDFRRNY